MNAKANGVEWESQPADSIAQTENIHLGPAVIHRPSGRVETPAGAQRLRTKELALVEHLFQNASITFSREELLLRVWRCQPGLLTRTVDQTVENLFGVFDRLGGLLSHDRFVDRRRNRLFIRQHPRVKCLDCEAHRAGE